jgi:alkylation response protein AidB-like acyl-CoA dehydrogenase
MRFAPDEAAETLRAATADVLRGYAPGDDTDGTWDKLAAVGALGTLVSESCGGLGLDENALVPLLDEIGYSGLPVPAAETIAVAAPLIAQSLGTAGGYHNQECQTIFAALLDGGDLLPFGRRAQLIVLRAGDTLRLYQRDELTLEQCGSVDGSRAIARIVRRPAGGGVLLTDDAMEVEAAWQRGVLGTSALLTGLARRMLDMTVTYVRGREQYGVPVGSFQAVKHALADALVAVEFARPVVLAAGWAQAAHTEDAPVQTSAAKVAATDAARLVARTAIQCHGAMGYTTEYDLHVFAKRVWALAPSWGGVGRHRAQIAQYLGVADG